MRRLSARESHRVRDTLAQGTRFLGLGLISYPLGLLITAAVHEWIGLTAELATAIALGCLVVFNFAVSRRFVFRAQGRAAAQLVKFGTASLLMRGMEYMLFVLMLSYGGVHYLVSLAVAMAISATAKFLVYRNFVFNPGARSGSGA
jgi:putative flippase GtrA